MTLAQPFKPQPTMDAPFLAPLECVMDLPWPPSTNEIWRQAGRRVILSESYRLWKKQADMAVIANGCWRHRVRMPAAFTAEIMLDRARRRRGTSDVDNRIKAVLDWAQRVELVRNDAHCEDVRARWVDTAEAPHGVRLILRSIA